MLNNVTKHRKFNLNWMEIFVFDPAKIQTGKRQKKDKVKSSPSNPTNGKSNSLDKDRHSKVGVFVRMVLGFSNQRR